METAAFAMRSRKMRLITVLFLAGTVMASVAAPRLHAALLPTGRGEIMGKISKVRFTAHEDTEPDHKLAEIEITDGRKQKAAMTVTRDTMIRNPAWLRMSVSSLKKGREVKAEYRLTDEGANEAVFIYYYKDEKK